MAFYQPENFTDPASIEYEKSHRILQPVYELIKDGHEEVLRSSLFPPVLAIGFYFMAITPFTIVDIFGHNWKWVQKYKIQANKRVSWTMLWNTWLLLVWNHMMFIIPMALVQAMWAPPCPLPPVAPTLWEFAWQQIVWFFMFDAYYWAFHALLHKVRFLYRWIHSVHHQFHSPFAMMTQHLHPIELFYVGFGITVIPWFFTPHIFTYWSWFIVANWISIEVHCGYDIPFAADKFCSIYGGAPKHDMHHFRPMSNYEPWLGYLDRLFGWELTKDDLEKLKEKSINIGLQHPDDETFRQKFN